MIKYKYNSLAEFKFDNPKEYRFLLNKDLLNKLCEDMGWDYKLKKPSGYWTKERCMEESLKYKNKTTWKRHSSSSHSAARENGWYDECTAHMIVSKFTNKIKQKAIEIESPKLKKTNKGKLEFKVWTKESCIEEALKYPFKNRWKQNSCGSYIVAKRNGWFEECIAHMVEVKKPSGYWTKERCIEDALKYKLKTEWKRYGGSSHYAAKHNGWYDECTAHMKNKK